MAAILRANIYIVDDDASVRKALARVTRSADLNTAVFSSASDFLESDYKTKTSNSCIVMDINMPGKCSGLDLMSRFQKENIKIPVIIVSAQDDPKTKKAMKDAGAFCYFRKPVDSEALLDAILWALGQSNNGSSHK